MLILLKTHVQAYERDGVMVRAHDRRPMYASRKVLNGQELHDWAVRQGFKNVTPADKMHVTVAYSRAPVHHESVEPCQRTLMATPAGLGHLGDENAVVLHMEHPRLHDRWHHMREKGASWDHEMGEGYKPHVSISYKGQDIPSAVEPFNGPLHLGPEVVEDLKSGWGSEVEKGAEKPITKALDVGLVVFTKARVGAYMRGGKLVNIAGYDGRQARAQPAPGQMSLFPAPEPGPAKPNPFRDKDPVLDTPDLFSGKTRREEPVAPPAPAPAPAPVKMAHEEPGNGHEFGELYHGAPVPFDKFDPGRRNSSGAGFDHQGKGFYLTDDPHGYARFFAKESGAKLAFHLMVQGKKEESDKISDGHGHVMSVKLKPGTKVLRLEDAPDYIKQLFDKSVGNKEVAQELRDSVRKLGYHALNFQEPNYPEGWRTREKARTTVVYDTDKADITGSRDAAGLDLHDEHPYWSHKSGPDLEGKHPLQYHQKRLDEVRSEYADAHNKGDEEGKNFYRHVLDGIRDVHKKHGAAFAAYHQHGDGTELSTEDGRRHAILLPDASSPGKYRYQMFDDRGFSAHSTHNTPEEAVADAASQGYHVHNPGILDRLAGTDEWAHGMAVNAVMQAHNSGQMSWADAMDKIKALHDEREAKRAPPEPEPAAPAPPADDHPSKPTKSLLNLVPEDRRAEWEDLHRRQHEMHHYDLGQIREELERARSPMRRAQTAMREAEAGAAEARRGGDLPGTDERVRLADAAVAKHRAEFDKRSAEVGRLKDAHQSTYERVAKLGRQKDAIASATGDMDIDWASMKKRSSEDQAKHEKSMLKRYRDYYKAQDAARRAAKKPGTMAKAWDWLGTEPLHGQRSLFIVRAA